MKQFRSLAIILSLASLLAIPCSNIAMRRYSVPLPAHVAALRAGIPSDCSQPPRLAGSSTDADWITRVDRLRWVAYSSPNHNPEPGYFQPSPDAIRADLLTLRKAGFNGLVTYASAGIMGKEFLTIAQSLGFKGIIMGVWNPNNALPGPSAGELKNAKEASSNPIVFGYSIGNEGLYESRASYTLIDVCAAIADLRSATGLPATTSEQLDDYENHPELLAVGDWVFPIAHPYWHSTKRPLDAVQWELERYQDTVRLTDMFVFFKEVGLPTSGAAGLSEENHDLYYRELARTSVRFVYFEGFDQPSKSHAAVEPYWGIFSSDLSPKLLAWNLMGYRQFTSVGAYDGWSLDCANADAEGCLLDRDSSTLRVGSDSNDRTYHAFLSFDTTVLPDDARITSVKLRVRTFGVEGFDPLRAGGRLVAEACADDCIVIGEFVDAPVNGWYILDLNAFESIDVRGTTQIRLSILTREGAESRKGYMKFYSGDAADANRPMLIVRYDVP